jgi:uncharacterized protein YwqG
MYESTYMYEDISGNTKFCHIKPEETFCLLENYELNGTIIREKILFKSKKYEEKYQEWEELIRNKLIEGYKRWDYKNVKDINWNYKLTKECQEILSKKGLSKRVWIPISDTKPSSVVNSKFSGKPFILKGEEYPKCKKCNNNLELFVQINFEELPQEIKILKKGLIQFFLCHNQDCLESSNFYNNKSCLIGTNNSQMLKIIENINQEYQIISNESFFSEKTIIGWKELELEYPESVESEELNDIINIDYANIFHSINYEGEKIGGYPNFTQEEIYPECPDCSTPMKHLIQLGSNVNIPYMWGDGGYGHIYYCENHLNRIGFYWDCC